MDPVQYGGIADTLAAVVRLCDAIRQALQVVTISMAVIAICQVVQAFKR